MRRRGVWRNERIRCALLSIVMLLLSALAGGPALAVCSTLGLPEGRKVAQLQTSLGEICIELLDGVGEAPGHVENFLWYLDNDQLTNTFFHRRVAGFVIQGADFRFDGEVIERTDPRPDVEVTNEPCALPDPPEEQICAERGNEAYTVALAKQSGLPNSGTTSWFINLADNRPNLDNQNEGFTVFGRITDAASQAVVDAIAAAPDALPLYEELFWVGAETAQLRSLGDQIPYFNEPLPPINGGDTGGCTDLTDLATVLQPDIDDLLFELHDPEGQSPYYLTVSATCGTPHEGSIVGWLPQAGPPECPELDRAALRTLQPTQATGGLPTVPSPFEYMIFTCEQLEQAIADRDAYRATMQTEFFDGLVFIEDAIVQEVPEPSTASVAATALAAAAWLRNRSRRRRATRTT